MQVIDNRGLACPEPVIRTKKALENMAGGTLISVVDNAAAKENVLRLAKSLGHMASVAEEDDAFRITITKQDSTTIASSSAAADKQRIALMISSELFGQGDRALGEVLMKSFFHALTESDDLPQVIYFVNSAVNLTCQGSAILDKIAILQEKGVLIYSCGTCLDFYQLKDQLAIGEVTNMFSIMESMLQADKTITL